MGRHQAANLLKKGYQVVVLDRSPDAVSALVAKGIIYTINVKIS